MLRNTEEGSDSGSPRKGNDLWTYPHVKTKVQPDVKPSVRRASSPQPRAGADALDARRAELEAACDPGLLSAHAAAQAAAAAAQAAAGPTIEEVD